MQVRALQARVRPATAHGYRPPAIPAVIRESSLMRRGGFDVFEGLVDADTRNRMLSEALSRLSDATVCDVRVSDNEEVRGGTPRRRFSNGVGGPLQQAFIKTLWVLDFLRGLTTSALVSSGEVG